MIGDKMDAMTLSAHLCECGCGQQTKIATRDRANRGWTRGHPMPCLIGHRRSGANPKGYKQQSDGGRGREIHRVLAERAFGRALPPGAEVHHVDGDIGARQPRLIICQDRAYHRLLHRRARVVKAGGNPNTQRFCYRCRTVKDVMHFSVNRARVDALNLECRSCAAVLNRRYRENLKLKASA